MSPVYRSPSSGSAAAATTPARLAQEFHGATLWRTAPTGETEVVTLRDGILERYVVHEDGSATLVETSRRPLGYRWGLHALVVGAVLAIGAGIAMGALGEPKLVLVALVGMALFAGGGLARGRADDLRSRAEEAYGGKGEWHLPTKLRGWMPRTSEQLTMVERLADDHKGVAFVRDVGARTVDVFAVGKGRVERYWVDEHGHAGLAEEQQSGTPYAIDQALKATALLLWFGILGVGLLVQEHKGALLIALIAALAFVMLIGWRNDPEARLVRRLKRGADGQHWIEIRTSEPENDA